MGRFHLFAVVVLLAMALGGTAQAQSATRIGQVASLTGPAIALRGDQAVSLYRGAPIYRSDRLRTLADSKIRIAFDDGSELILGSGSTVLIARFAPGSGESGSGLLRLLKGILRIALGHGGHWKRFDVESRFAVASARSTEWIVQEAAKGDAVFVVSGTVAVRAAGQEVVLGPGDGTDIAPGAPPTPSHRWGAARANQVQSATTVP